MKMKPITWEVNENNCWICTSHKKDKDGYPVGYKRKIHRHVYEQCFGEIPIDMVVMHKCDNPSCINPEHLIIGTYKDNTEDMYSKGREGRVKPVIQYTLSGKFIKRFTSLAECARENNFKDSKCIIECCKRRQLYTHGYKFKYERNDDLSVS